MKLVSHNGVKVSVSDEKGERLLKQGYKRLDPASPDPVSPPPVADEAPKRRTRRKTAES